MKCPGCQHEHRTGAKFCDECGTPLAGTAPLPPYTELKDENELLGRSLSEARQQQTATSEILRAISEAQTDPQPVFDAIARNTVRLCEAARSTVWRPEGDVFRAVARCEMTPEGRVVSAPRGEALDVDSLPGMAIRERRILRVNDVPDNPIVPPKYRERARIRGYRSLMAVPMVHERLVVGVITVVRPASVEFSDQQLALVQSFADHAVIGIENVRLLNETKEALEQQTATAEILRVISSSPTDLQPVLDTLVESAGRLCQAADTFLLLVEGDQLRVAALHGSVGETAKISNAIDRGWVAGRAVVESRTVHVEDLSNAEAEFPLGAAIAARFGHRTALAIPLSRGGAPTGALFLRRREVRRFSDKEVALLQTFADQAVIAIENVRLFTELQTRNREVEDKSRQLEVASQHKSEFLANMSHELRTPLNAIIGFSEVLSERMFGELNEKQGEYLRDIYGSGQHLLSLINDILDLSKIEAGRMELEFADFDLPSAIDNTLTLVRERAGRRSIALQQTVDERLGQVGGDERKIKQVLLNLLSNALKFTPEGGRIEVRAGLVDGMAEISVVDTGVGIAPEDQEAIFEEFRQVGTAARNVEGTGLGLALSRKFIGLHGGRIWVKSHVGAGSTFTFTLPLTAAPRHQTA